MQVNNDLSNESVQNVIRGYIIGAAFRWSWARTAAARQDAYDLATAGLIWIADGHGPLAGPRAIQ